MMGFGFLWIIVILLITIYVIRAMFPQSSGTETSSKQPQEETAVEILRRRYANGEIDKEEFDSIRNGLS